MIIELIEYIGELKNDTGINAHAYLFSINNDEYTFETECILYVHKDLESFVSLYQNNDEALKKEILKEIFKKYTKEQLLGL